MIKVLCCACFVLVSAVAAAQSQPNATHTLYLIRHGAYVADRNADPQLGPGITALGVAQARLIAARLSGAGVAFDRNGSRYLRLTAIERYLCHTAFRGLGRGELRAITERR